MYQISLNSNASTYRLTSPATLEPSRETVPWPPHLATPIPAASTHVWLTEEVQSHTSVDKDIHSYYSIHTTYIYIYIYIPCIHTYRHICTDTCVHKRNAYIHTYIQTNHTSTRTHAIHAHEHTHTCIIALSTTPPPATTILASDNWCEMPKSAVSTRSGTFRSASSMLGLRMSRCSTPRECRCMIAEVIWTRMWRTVPQVSVWGVEDNDEANTHHTHSQSANHGVTGRAVFIVTWTGVGRGEGIRSKSTNLKQGGKPDDCQRSSLKGNNNFINFKNKQSQQQHQQ